MTIPCFKTTPVFFPFSFLNQANLHQLQQPRNLTQETRCSSGFPPKLPAVKFSTAGVKNRKDSFGRRMAGEISKTLAKDGTCGREGARGPNKLKDWSDKSTLVRFFFLS